MSRIFISYSRKDIETARRLAAELQKAGFDVWWDISGLKGGDAWLRVIPAAIDSSQFFVILLTKSSVESQWVEKEYVRALGRRMKIIPLLLEPCDVPFALANINYLDFSANDDQTNLKNLLEALETGRVPPPATPTLPQTHQRWIWIGAAIILGILLLVSVLRACTTPLPPTATPSSEVSLTPAQTATPTSTITPTPTETPTPTIPATFTPTTSSTSTHTPTPTLTVESSPRVELCVQPEIGSLWVRTGPGRVFETYPRALSGGHCLIFSARDESGGWLMIGPRQPNHDYADFEYGWVAANFLENPYQIPLPVATPLPTATRTPLPTFTPTPTATLTFTPTITFTPTETFTPIPTDTRMPTATDIAIEPAPNP